MSCLGGSLDIPEIDIIKIITLPTYRNLDTGQRAMKYVFTGLLQCLANIYHQGNLSLKFVKRFG